MKNYRLAFYFESIFVLGLLYLFFYGSFHQYLGDTFLQVASIINLVVGAVSIISLVIVGSLVGFKFNNLVRFIEDKKNPAGIIIRYFSYYLILSFITNLIILGVYGEESEFASSLLLNVNFILLTPFALIGILKGFWAAQKIWSLMKNVQKGFVGVIVAVVIVVVLVGGAVYVYNEKEADTVLQENNKEQITETDTIKTSPQELKVENKIQVITKNGWGDCTSVVIKKLPFNYDQMKANYGGRVYMDRFYVKFDGRAQVELKDGKLVSACGADVQSVNELLIKNGLTITYLDSLKTDFQVLVSKGSDIDKQKVAIEKVYNVQFTERVNLVPMAVPAGMR